MTNRKLQPAVTVFLYHQHKYLMLQRSAEAAVDAQRLNGLGGKVESDETYVQAAVREIKEESGFEIQKKKVVFCGLAHISGGYPVDWLVAFFKVRVPGFEIPAGKDCREGKFLWLKPEEILTQDFELVDDLHYLFDHIVAHQKNFFARIKLNNQEKVEQINIDFLKK